MNATEAECYNDNVDNDDDKNDIEVAQEFLLPGYVSAIAKAIMHDVVCKSN